MKVAEMTRERSIGRSHWHIAALRAGRRGLYDQVDHRNRANGEADRLKLLVRMHSRI